jgi:predicted DNA-binding transcriptional regulator AlpA
MLRIAARLPRALQVTGLSKSQFYKKIEEGKIPRGTKIDPEGRIVVWWESDLEELQNRAIAAAATHEAA